MAIGGAISTPTKAFLKDGTIILFQDGFVAIGTQVKGQGRRFTLGGSANPNLEDIVVARDDIVAMTYFQRNVENQAGGVLLGLTALPLTITAVYCLACPKCCFGSCPTVYIKDGGENRLAAELFSFSVGSFVESDDLDMLADRLGPPGGPFEIRVTNEAMETHRINYLRLLKVSHPRGTSVLPTADNQVVAFSQFLPPAEARNSAGSDVFEAIAVPDQRTYRSPQSMVEKLKTGPFFDHLDLKIKVPPGASSGLLRLRLRNTLLSTLLFYDIVLGSQGLEALAWTEKMNSDPLYAGRFWLVYRFFSGITVKTLDATGWTTVGKIPDVGPIAFKDIAARLPLPGDGRNELNVRLEFVPDNFMIDAVAFDFETSQSPAVTVEPLELERIFDQTGKERPEVRTPLERKDGLYLTVEPGEAYRMVAQVPVPADEGNSVSLFVASRGYYYEWLRGKWLAPQNPTDYRFDLNDTAGTLRQLAERWLASKEALEDSFFKARIPIRGER